MSGLSHGIVVIWLDNYIGNPNDYNQLKAAFSSMIDPTYSEPIGLNSHYDINSLLNNSHSLFPFRSGAPHKFETFTNPEECSGYIRHSLESDERIYLIVSDDIGKTFLPHLFVQYPEAFHSNCISIYIFTFYVYDNINPTDWLFDYEQYVLVFYHEADLLYRLLRDISQYYTTIGKILLNQGNLNDTHQALTYFQWASVLFYRAEQIAIYQDLKPIQDLRYLIHLAEEIIENETNLLENTQYSRTDLERSLRNSIFIYYSEEFHNEAAQLFSVLQNLTKEQGTMVSNCDTLIDKLKTERCTIKYYCPIVMPSSKDDCLKILKELSSLPSINQIYVLIPNEYIFNTIKESIILQDFPKVQNMYSESKILVLEWIAERASLCDKIGDLCMENDDHDLGRMYCTKAIQLNKQLAAFIKKK